MNNRAILLLGLLALLLLSCGGDKREPSIVFMPDMYYPTAYDPYMEANFDYVDDHKESDVALFRTQANMTALQPVKNTVPRTDGDLLPWDLPNTNSGYNASKAVVASPLNPADKAKNLEQGKVLYEINCAVCHGVTGDGKGSIVESGAYSGVPTYAEREITVGSVYHVIMYGRNAMGSYAPQMIPADRWKVAEYVMELKNKK